MSGWVDVQKIYRSNISRIQFQAVTEEKKKVNKDLAESLKHQAEAENKRAHELESATKSLVASIFAVRFRDCNDEVRRTVIKSFSTWVEKAPDIYLQDTFLKYLGWALSDKVRRGINSTLSCSRT
jgi:cohesin complex subunit SA-1/2